MNLNRFDRPHHYFSKKARDFISDRGLEPSIREVDREEDDEARSELIELCGGSQEPSERLKEARPQSPLEARRQTRS